MAFCFIFLIINFTKIKAFLIISMEIIRVDDCVSKINLEDKAIFENNNCDIKHYEKFEISYEIGQKINIEVYDIGCGWCYLDAKINVYNINSITAYQREFWYCENCENDIFDEENQKLSCYKNFKSQQNDKKHYNFYFKISRFSQLGLDMPGYYYYLTDKIYFFITSSILSRKIDLIDLSLENNLYIKIHNEKKKLLEYTYIYYQLFFYEYFNNEGNFYGSDTSNNDIKLENKIYSRIFQNKALRYELSEEEKKNNGTQKIKNRYIS